jgi:FkbM family methyltransferase
MADECQRRYSMRPTRTLMLPRMGIIIHDPQIPASGRLVLSLLSYVGSTPRKRLLFGTSRLHSLIQKVTQRFVGLGGPAAARIQYTRGLLATQYFECFTSEQYFLMGSAFETMVQRTLPGLLKPGDVAFDIGANVGFWSLVFSTLVGANGRVFAFEPSPKILLRLGRNLQMNKKENINPIQKAVSDVEGSASFLDNGSESQILPASSSSAGACIQVSTIRLDDFVYRDSHARPNLVKIDIEGHAGPCLMGGERVLAESKPYVLCEIHHPEELSQVGEILKQHSYQVVPLEPTTDFPWHLLASPR